jgi:DNA polymerase (family 10)
MSKNQELADIFRRLGSLLEIRGEIIFKVRAYNKAADLFARLPEDVETLLKEDRLKDLPGVGAAIFDKTAEYLETGKIAAYEEITKSVPESVLDLLKIPSLGPRKVKLFFDELRIKNLDDLARALERGDLAALPGMKEKTLENIRQGLTAVRRGQERMDLGAARVLAEKFITALKAVREAGAVEAAGSLRRGKETVRDIDLLVCSDAPEIITRAFVDLPFVRKVNAHGVTKASVLSDTGVQVDLRVVPREDYGAALLYFTGSKEFSIRIRQIAREKNLKVNEYGVFKVTDRGERKIAGRTEKECLRALGLPDIPPELREGLGEEAIFGGAKIPRLIGAGDIRGELHTHSTWSDGRNSIEEMAAAARARGYEYLAVSDHSYKLRVANGLSAQDLERKRAEIELLNRRLKGFTVLCGSEVEIDKDGSLDYNDQILSSLDVVVAAVHTHFGLSRSAQTRRLVRALENPLVHVLAHPFGRHLAKREPYEVDFKEICRASADNRVALEINAFPVRLDLDSANAYFAKKAGVRFVINTDAHRTDHFSHIVNGISIARRAWLEPGDVINTLPLGALKKALGK